MLELSKRLNISLVRWRLNQVKRKEPSRKINGQMYFNAKEVALRARLMWLTDPDLPGSHLVNGTYDFKTAKPYCLRLANGEILQYIRNQERRAKMAIAKEKFFATYRKDPDELAASRAKWDAAQAIWRQRNGQSSNR